jgi:hypothetical protein
VPSTLGAYDARTIRDGTLLLREGVASSLTRSGFGVGLVGDSASLVALVREKSQTWPLSTFGCLPHTTSKAAQHLRAAQPE